MSDVKVKVVQCPSCTEPVGVSALNVIFDDENNRVFNLTRKEVAIRCGACGNTLVLKNGDNPKLPKNEMARITQSITVNGDGNVVVQGGAVYANGSVVSGSIITGNVNVSGDFVGGSSINVDGDDNTVVQSNKRRWRRG